MACGHCMAICPSESIRVAGLSYADDLFELPTKNPAGAFFDLIATRRSTRVFQDKPVPREALERIVEAIATAPMGYTPSKVEITVVQSRETIEGALPLMVDLYEGLVKAMDNLFIAFLIRRRVEPEAWTSLRDHVQPALKYRLPEMRAGREDSLTWGAPALLLFHAHQASGNHAEDILVALTYGLLAAHALGLGATAIGLVPQAVQRTPKLRAMFRIPAENEVLASMIVGYPKVRFRRGIRRKLAGVTWI
jgi:nitroreductase